MKKVECFKIRLYTTDNYNILNPIGCEVIYDVKCGTKRFTGNPVDIVADPFLFVHNDSLYLFYEAKRYREKGVIAMVKTNDLKNWSDPVVVLAEPFHLSYPYVFDDNGRIYMMPETCADHSIRLYEATDDSLEHFKLKKKLIERTGVDKQIMIDYSDSSILKQGGMYFLHTTVNYSWINYLELYVSRSLDGDYRQHPTSPIIKSQKYGRNAGCLLSIDGHIYRVAQDCVDRYGDNVHLFEVNQITPNEYVERIVKENLYDTNIEYYKEGGHQLNVVKFKGRYIVATDAKEYHYFFMSRIIHKIRKIFHI